MQTYVKSIYEKDVLRANLLYQGIFYQYREMIKFFWEDLEQISVLMVNKYTFMRHLNHKPYLQCRTLHPICDRMSSLLTWRQTSHHGGIVYFWIWDHSHEETPLISETSPSLGVHMEHFVVIFRFFIVSFFHDFRHFLDRFRLTKEEKLTYRVYFFVSKNTFLLFRLIASCSIMSCMSVANSLITSQA